MSEADLEGRVTRLEDSHEDLYRRHLILETHFDDGMAALKFIGGSAILVIVIQTVLQHWP